MCSNSNARWSNLRLRTRRSAFPTKTVRELCAFFNLIKLQLWLADVDALTANQIEWRLPLTANDRSCRLFVFVRATAGDCYRATRRESEPHTMPRTRINDLTSR